MLEQIPEDIPSPPTLQREKTLRQRVEPEEPLPAASLIDEITEKMKETPPTGGLDHLALFNRLPLSPERRQHVLARFHELESKRIKELNDLNNAKEPCEEGEEEKKCPCL